MSRIGKLPVKIPRDVSVKIEGNVVKAKGSKGELQVEVRPEISVTQEGDALIARIDRETKKSSAYWGMTRALLLNIFSGVTQGFEKKLELVGVGYRAKKVGSDIELTLGYSHPIVFKAIEGIDLDVEDQKLITVRGINKQAVGQVAAKIRALRKPEVYKGKGVRYVDEVVRTKPGKAGKV